MTEHTSAWDAIREHVNISHREYCSDLSCTCDPEIDRETSELYRAVVEEFDER